MEELGSSLRAEAEKHRQAGQAASRRQWILLGLIYGFGFVTHRWHVPSEIFLPVGILLPLLFLVNAFSMLGGRSRRKGRRLIPKVAEQAELRSIGPLLDAFLFNNRQTRHLTIDTLTALLPRLESDDAALLTPQNRALLRAQLKCATDQPFHKDMRTFFRPTDPRTIGFYIAILQAFERVGGPDELETVQWVAAQERPNPEERRIQKAAASCLLVLQPRVEAVRSSETLLRASEASGAASGTLLRATTESLAPVPEEMLRASSTVPDAKKP